LPPDGYMPPIVDPPVATLPEPRPIPLLLTAIGLLLGMQWWRRRSRNG
jgi:hypothetical protein